MRIRLVVSSLLLLALGARAADLRPVEITLPSAALVGPAGAAALSLQTPRLTTSLPPSVNPSAAVPQLALPAVPSLAARVAPQASAPSFGARALRSETTLGALGRFSGAVQASLRDGSGPGDGSDFSGYYDGERQHENEEELVRAEQREQKAEAVQYAHAERPVIDYLRGRFDPEEARELAGNVYELSDGDARTIKELLQLVMTAHAARTDNPPDLTRVDPTGFGVSDAQLRVIAEAEGLPAFALQRFLEQAFRHGLIYRLYDSGRQQTFYGVPQAVRDALGLKAPRAAEDVAREKAKESAFAKGLPALAEAAVKLPKGEELFEFAAQIVAAAVKGGLLSRDAVPPAFQKRADALSFDAPPLKDALLTLLESSEGTPWFARAKALCETAAQDGLLPRAELDQSLASLR
jgi:hypothetical protein